MLTTHENKTKITPIPKRKHDKSTDTKARRNPLFGGLLHLFGAQEVLYKCIAISNTTSRVLDADLISSNRNKKHRALTSICALEAQH